MATAGATVSPTRGPLGLMQADTAKNITAKVAGTLSAAAVAATETFYNDTDRPLRIVSVRATVGTAPTGATLIVDVNNDGTTVFTTQSKRPTIAISGTTAVVTDIENGVLAAGKALTFDVDQVGSTQAGANLAIQVVAVPA